MGATSEAGTATLPDNLLSPPDFSCSILSFVCRFFSFVYCIVCPMIYGLFLLHFLWHLQILSRNNSPKWVVLLTRGSQESVLLIWVIDAIKTKLKMIFFFFLVVVIFQFYIQYRHYNSFTQDITHTILEISDLDTYIFIHTIFRVA